MIHQLRLVTDAPPRVIDSLAASAVKESLPQTRAVVRQPSLREALQTHWPEYLLEAFGLGLFMISACAFGALLEYPGSPVHQAISNATLRRVLMGMAMGGTAIVNVYAPWGQRSGSHLNPAFTWTLFRLGKVHLPDAIFYTLAQFAGGIGGVWMAQVALRHKVAHPAVNYVATTPGMSGIAIAFIAEIVVTFILMSVVLKVSNTPRLSRFTPLFAGALVMLYISIEAPLSGMSMNPARTVGSALFAGTWTALWIYFTAPLVGMLIAAETYRRLAGAKKVYCAKLHHHNDKRCIFRCNFNALVDQSAASAPSANNL